MQNNANVRYRFTRGKEKISKQRHYLMDTNVTLITENHLIAVFTIGLQTQQHIHLQTKLFHDCTQTSYVDNAACSGITGR